MKAKFLIINASLLSAVLFTILFQSVHLGEHLFTEYFSEPIVIHQHQLDDRDTSTKITDNHYNKQHTCSICEFTLSSIVPHKTLLFQLFSSHETIPYCFTIVEASVSVLENSFGLRAPPFSIG